MFTRGILAVHSFADGRTMSLVQISPRRARVAVESAVTHSIDGINFVQHLRGTPDLTLKEAKTKFNEWQKIM